MRRDAPTSSLLVGVDDVPSLVRRSGVQTPEASHAQSGRLIRASDTYLETRARAVMRWIPWEHGRTTLSFTAKSRSPWVPVHSVSFSEA